MATLVSTFFVFVLMASYYILRDVRDAMASDWSDSEVSFLWNINFFVSAAIVAIYGFAVSHVRFRYVVPAIYGFFVSMFLVFIVGISTLENQIVVDKAFYLWVSVFALFHVSVFWTFMADTFNKDQARRLFGIIGAGASAGAIFGPTISAGFAEDLGIEILMLIATAGLATVIPLVFVLYYLKGSRLGNRGLEVDTSGAKLGGHWWQGFRSFASNPYLLGIGAFILLYVFINSFFYFAQKNLLADFTRVERVQILASISWIVNTLTFALAFFLTGRIVTKLGMSVALALMPLLVAVGFMILAFAPLLTVLLALQVIRRGGNYGLTRPAREMLFTNVTPEDRFKAKPVIDIVVYRGGDAVSGTLFALLTDGIGLGLAAIATVGAGIAAAWAWLGARLGRLFDGNPQASK